MFEKKLSKAGMAIAVLWLVGVSSAQGVVIIDAVETGGDVVFTYTGTINQGGWTLIPGPTGEPPFIDPNGADVVVGPTGSVASASFENPTSLVGPSNFGTGGLTFPSFGSGDIFGLHFPGRLVLPGGYVRNTPISGASTYSGETFASLGMGLGSYTWTWDTRPFAVGFDSVTLNVMSSSVPEPSSAVLVALGLVALRWRRAARKRMAR